MKVCTRRVSNLLHAQMHAQVAAILELAAEFERHETEDVLRRMEGRMRYLQEINDECRQQIQEGNLAQFQGGK